MNSVASCERDWWYAPLARPLRIQFPGAVYHVISRGNERKPIVRDDDDRENRADWLQCAVETYGWHLFAFVLMTNHEHLFLKTPEPNLSAGMQYLNGSYASCFNRRYRRAGHLFQGRFKGHLVEEEGYFLEVSRYIHLNRVRARWRRVRGVSLEQLFRLRPRASGGAVDRVRQGAGRIRPRPVDRSTCVRSVRACGGRRASAVAVWQGNRRAAAGLGEVREPDPAAHRRLAGRRRATRDETFQWPPFAGADPRSRGGPLWLRAATLDGRRRSDDASRAAAA